MTTLKDDGTVVVDIPTNIEAASLDLPSGDHHNVAFGGEPLDSSDLQHRPPMQIAMLPTLSRCNWSAQHVKEAVG